MASTFKSRALLAANKFDHRLASGDGFDNLRHGAQKLADQCAIVDIADAHLEHDRSLPLCGAKKREIAILGDKNSRSRNGLVPDHPVQRICHPEIDDVGCIVTSVTHSFRKRGWKLRIDQIKQAIWPL
ncbi:hypothetical protein WHZ77_16245 [Bradyrhizobium sp. A5]